LLHFYRISEVIIQIAQKNVCALTNSKWLPYGNIPYPGSEEGLNEQINEKKLCIMGKAHHQSMMEPGGKEGKKLTKRFAPTAL